ncbi:hypothetical protein ACJIZ3_002319 [Penstemon smallii]|uniref:RING-CH-type domain-containing protein n=1 Tax=Penstemon smallii TaxID=265156 RepID=A0ABD3U7M5_9LAMI
MGDHFVLMVNRLITESTLEAVIHSENRLQHTSPSTVSENMTNGYSFHRMDIDIRSPPNELEECCRICHDEDQDSNMEIPCSCRGSLKYAHRKCVQRWCNEKGDTICEICLQQFKPDYTAPPPLFHYGGIPMNFRGDWEISTRDMHNPQFIPMINMNGDYLDPNIDDYPVASSRNFICCRIVAMIFIVLVVLRHTLPFILYGSDEYSISLFLLLMLRTIGIVLPIYIMVKTFTAVQRRRNGQFSSVYPLESSDEENELARHQPHSHLIHVP